MFGEWIVWNRCKFNYCDITAGKTEAKKENYKIKTSCTSIDDLHDSKSNRLNRFRRKLKLQTTFINQS